MVVATAVVLPPTAAPTVLTGSIEGYIYWGTQPVGGLRVGAGFGSHANVVMQPTTTVTRADGYFRLDGLRPSALYFVDVPAQGPYHGVRFGGFYQVYASKVTTAVAVDGSMRLLMDRRITNVFPAEGQVVAPGALLISWDPVTTATMYCVEVLEMISFAAVTTGTCGGARSGTAAVTTNRFQTPTLVSGHPYRVAIRSFTNGISTGSAYVEFRVR